MWEWVVEHYEFVIGSAIGLAGVAVAIWLYARQKSPKILDYAIESDIQLVHAEAKNLKELLVTYDSEIISDPRIVVVRFRNVGKQAIRADDFKGADPVIIRFSDGWYSGGDVVKASQGLNTKTIARTEFVSDSSDENPAHKNLAITPNLLNPKEWFSVQLFSDGPHGDIEVSGRFAGQTRPMRRVYPPAKSNPYSPIPIAFAASFISILSYIAIQSIAPTIPALPAALVISLIVGVVTPIAALLASFAERLGNTEL